MHWIGSLVNYRPPQVKHNIDWWHRRSSHGVFVRENGRAVVRLSRQTKTRSLALRDALAQR